MEIPDDLLRLYTARVERRDGRYVIEVPDADVRDGRLDRDTVYRVGLLPAPTAHDRDRGEDREPPVEVGDVRTVEIEGIGDQGDGIARVERGYVVIVPGVSVGDRVEVEIEALHPTFAMGRVVGSEED